MKKEPVIVMCPPLSDYPEAPKDQSKSELFDCPKCKQKMWLSEKKKGVLAFASCIGKPIILAFYPCIEEMVKKDPSLIMKHKRVDI